MSQHAVLERWRSLRLQLGDDQPLYQQIALALEQDITAGSVPPGLKLPTQRDLARALKVNIATVTKAYGELQKLGLVVSGPGRGSYVRCETEDIGDASGPERTIDLTINRPATGAYVRALSETMARLPGDPRFQELQDYHPPEGLPWARSAGVDWIGLSGLAAAPDRMVVTSGAQHGLMAALTAGLHPGDVVLTTSLTYYGMKALAGQMGFELHGLASDAEGILPDAVDAACRERRVRALFMVPCLDNPTTVTMPLERREHVAAVAQRHDLIIIEDDVYGPLLPTRPAPFAALCPERTIYVTGTSKTLAPGLRAGFVLVPPALSPATAAAVRTSCWMASPLSVLIIATWIQDGTAEKLIAAQRTELAARYEIARSALAGFAFDCAPISTHLWLHLPSPWRAVEFAGQIGRKGVSVLPAETFVVGRVEAPHAVRINLGAARSRADLQHALERIAQVLTQGPQALDASI